MKTVTIRVPDDCEVQIIRKEDIIKYVIVKRGTVIDTDKFCFLYSFLAFHTAEQRDEFLKYNEQLIKDYLMID